MQITGYWYGVKGVWFVWNGSQADPYLIYRNKCVNSFDVEDCMWEDFLEYCEENHFDSYKEGLFDSYIRDNKNDILKYISLSDRKGLSYYDIKNLKYEYHFLNRLQERFNYKKNIQKSVTSIDTHEVA